MIQYMHANIHSLGTSSPLKSSVDYNLRESSSYLQSFQNTLPKTSATWDLQEENQQLSLRVQQLSEQIRRISQLRKREREEEQQLILLFKEQIQRKTVQLQGKALIISQLESTILYLHDQIESQFQSETSDDDLYTLTNFSIGRQDDQLNQKISAINMKIQQIKSRMKTSKVIQVQEQSNAADLALQLSLKLEKLIFDNQSINNLLTLKQKQNDQLQSKIQIINYQYHLDKNKLLQEIKQAQLLLNQFHKVKSTLSFNNQIVIQVQPRSKSQLRMVRTLQQSVWRRSNSSVNMVLTVLGIGILMGVRMSLGV